MVGGLEAGRRVAVTGDAARASAAGYATTGCNAERGPPRGGGSPGGAALAIPMNNRAR
jgi:hypothetical protein